jgi:DNA-binding response OmpR family regulator
MNTEDRTVTVVIPAAVKPKPASVRRALAVDDEPGVLRLMSRALGAEGIEVDQASDGEEGLRRALAGRYDVIVLDLELPKLDGMTVLRHLLSARPAQAIVISSCTSDPLTRSECVRAGARGFLAKPFLLIDLLTSVASACTNSLAGSSAR